MHKGGRRIIRQKRSEKTFSFAAVAAMPIAPPVSALPIHMMSGTMFRLFAGEHRAGAAKPGGDFIGNEQNVMSRAALGDGGECLGRMEFHPAGALHQRLDESPRQSLFARP